MDLASRLALVSSGENGFSELIWNILMDFEKSTTFCPWLKLNIIFGVMCTISWLVYLQAKYFRPSDYRFKFLGIVTRTIFSCVSWPPEVEQSYKCKKGLCLSSSFSCLCGKKGLNTVHNKHIDLSGKNFLPQEATISPALYWALPESVCTRGRVRAV